MNSTAQQTAIGIIRVSQKAGREGDSFVSPIEQRERIETSSQSKGLNLVRAVEEIDVPGSTPLAKRDGLREAVEAIEAGEAGVLVVAYFDRLVRSLRIQGEVVSRVEAVGGQVLTVDVGAISERTAAQWLSGTMLGAVNEYAARAAAERSREAQAAAIERGAVPFPNLPPGLRRIDVPKGHPDHGKVEPDPATRNIAGEAFRLRAEGATIAAIREYLREKGIERSFHGVGAMLEQRLYLGELHFGNYEPNLTACEAIIERDLFDRVQRMKVARGRRGKSDRLLARLGVLRCANCGGRMSVGTQTQNGRSYSFYRCAPTGDCQQRVTIGAEIAERVVTDAVRAALADVEGRASVEDNAREAETGLAAAQADLDAAIRAFAGLEDEQAARDRLAELRALRDQAQERVDHLGASRAQVVVNADTDWNDLSLDARRALIRATVDQVLVRSGGKGAERLTVQLVSE